MNYTAHTPAISAGLLAAVPNFAVTSASARTHSAAAFSLPALSVTNDFLLGLAVGVLASGVVVFITFTASEKLDKRKKQDGALAVSSPSATDGPEHSIDGQVGAAPVFSGTHAAVDYVDVAEHYVQKISWHERMAARAAGVKTMLTERLGQDMMQDVPVITRADGSVGDVGTSWWDAAVASKHYRLQAIPSTEEVLEATASYHVENPAPMQNNALSSPSRSEQIRHRVPVVDLGVFPENSTRARIDNDDALWAQAMSAMDARDTEPATAAGTPSDELDPATLHAPDTPTEVLPFRPVAGHPEVVDQSSYVDYLLRQEMEKNGSDAVKRTSRDYLRLLEGGSLSTAPTLFNLARTRRDHAGYVAKHLAAATQESEYSKPLGSSVNYRVAYEA